MHGVIALPELTIATPHPLVFGDEHAAEVEEQRRAVLAHVPDGASPGAIGVWLRPRAA